MELKGAEKNVASNAELGINYRPRRKKKEVGLISILH
jgi:hypothetical protein